VVVVEGTNWAECLWLRPLHNTLTELQLRRIHEVRPPDTVRRRLCAHEILGRAVRSQPGANGRIPYETTLMLLAPDGSVKVAVDEASGEFGVDTESWVRRGANVKWVDAPAMSRELAAQLDYVHTQCNPPQRVLDSPDFPSDIEPRDPDSYLLMCHPKDYGCIQSAPEHRRFELPVLMDLSAVYLEIKKPPYP
jgi:hypothetical protein